MSGLLASGLNRTTDRRAGGLGLGLIVRSAGRRTAKAASTELVHQFRCSRSLKEPNGLTRAGRSEFRISCLWNRM